MSEASDHGNRQRRRVLILGGGFAGIGAARKLKDADVDVVLVDRHDYHTFQPLLYQVATDLLETRRGRPSAARPVPRSAERRGAPGHGDADRPRGPRGAVRGDDTDPLRLPRPRARRAGQLLRRRRAPAEHAFPLYTLADAVRLKEHILRKWEAADRDPALVARRRAQRRRRRRRPDRRRERRRPRRALSQQLRQGLSRHPAGRRAPDARRGGAGALLDVQAGHPRVHARRRSTSAASRCCSARSSPPSTPTRVTLRSGTSIPAHTLVWGAGLQANAVLHSLGIELQKGNRIRVGPDLRVPEPPRDLRGRRRAWITDTGPTRCSPSSARSRSRPASRPARTSPGCSTASKTEPVPLPRQGHDGHDRPRLGRDPDAPRTHDQGQVRRRSRGAPCTSPCSRPARIAPRRSSTGRGPGSRTSVRPHHRANVA